jgi:hypothetical protein
MNTELYTFLNVSRIMYHLGANLELEGGWSITLHSYMAVKLSQVCLVVSCLRDFHVFGTLKEEFGWQAIGDRHRRKTSCHLTTDACYRFIKRGYTNLSHVVGQMLHPYPANVENMVSS